MGDRLKKIGGALGGVTAPDQWETIDKLRELLGNTTTLTLKRMRVARMHEISCIAQAVRSAAPRCAASRCFDARPAVAPGCMDASEPSD